MHEYVTILTQNEAIDEDTESGGGRAPMASFWVRIMTSCMNIKRGVLESFDQSFFTVLRMLKKECYVCCRHRGAPSQKSPISYESGLPYRLPEITQIHYQNDVIYGVPGLTSVDSCLPKHSRIRHWTGDVKDQSSHLMYLNIRKK